MLSDDVLPLLHNDEQVELEILGLGVTGSLDAVDDDEDEVLLVFDMHQNERMLDEIDENDFADMDDDEVELELIVQYIVNDAEKIDDEIEHYILEVQLRIVDEDDEVDIVLDDELELVE